MAEQPTPSIPSAPALRSETRLFDERFLRKLERLALLSRRAMAGQLQGERRSPKRGQSVEFADFRPYSSGDDFRRIDWNAYARLERFFIKLFVEEEDLTVHLLVDTSRSMDWGEPNKLAYAAKAAGALGYIALAGLDRITVTAIGEGRAANGAGVFPPRRGKQQALAFFNYLTGLQAAGQAPLASRLRTYAAGTARPGPLLLFSDLLDDGWQEGLRALAGRGFDITVLHILAPDEWEPQLQGDLRLRDLETGADLEVTIDDDLLRRYRQGLDAWQAALRQFCAARGIHYIPLSTALPFEDLLFTLLVQRGVLR